MGKYYFFAILLCSLAFSLKSQAAGFSGGKGTETEPYLIKTAPGSGRYGRCHH